MAGDRVITSQMLKTARLQLRPWDIARDMTAFSAICADPAVMRYIGDGHVWSEEESRDWLDRNIETMRMHGFCQWAVELAVADNAPEPIR